MELRESVTCLTAMGFDPHSAKPRRGDFALSRTDIDESTRTGTTHIQTVKNDRTTGFLVAKWGTFK